MLDVRNGHVADVLGQTGSARFLPGPALQFIVVANGSTATDKYAALAEVAGCEKQPFSPLWLVKV